MIYYMNDAIQESESRVTNTLGRVNLTSIGGAIPFYSFQLPDGNAILENNDDFCKGSCLEFLEDKLDISFGQIYLDAVNVTNTQEKYFDARVCTAEDIGEDGVANGTLFLCPPK